MDDPIREGWLLTRDGQPAAALVRVGPRELRVKPMTPELWEVWRNANAR